MHRFRTPWVALVSGAFLIALSASMAFGANPADTGDEPRGQTISAFVHELIFGTNDEGEEPPVEEGDAPDGDQEEDETTDSDTDSDTETDTDSDTDATDESTEEGDSATADNHGQCVRVVAQDPEAVGGPNENHGGAVSEAARETCWETEDTEQEVTEDEATAEEEESTEAKNHGQCVREVAQDPEATGGKNDNHGGAVSEAARETCHDEEATGDEGESDEATLASAADERGGNGKGHGKGKGGKP